MYAMSCRRQQPDCKSDSATCVPTAHGGQICAPLDIVAAAIEEWTGQPCPALPQDGVPLMLQVGGQLCNTDTQPVALLVSVLPIWAASVLYPHPVANQPAILLCRPYTMMLLSMSIR